MTRYTGKCLCGEITYVAEGPPVIVAQCHCDACKRLSGTGHTVGALFASNAVTLRGSMREFSYVSDKGTQVTKVSCATCASPIYGKNTGMPDHLTLTLGSMDDASDLEIDVVIYTRDRPHWDQLQEGVASFATQPDWKPAG